MSLLPADKTYISYEGSLTTPPCWEGLLWHVFTNPVTMSLRQLNQYRSLIGDKDCRNLDGSDIVLAHGRKLQEDSHDHDHHHDHHHHHSQAFMLPKTMEGNPNGRELLNLLPGTPSDCKCVAASSHH